VTYLTSRQPAWGRWWRSPRHRRWVPARGLVCSDVGPLQTSDRSAAGGHALAILPGVTHYDIADSPLFAAVILAFLGSGASW